MIICIPPKSITAAQKGQLTKKGFIVIETDEPEKVKVVMPEKCVANDDYYMAALYAIQSSLSDRASAEFVKELYKRLKIDDPKQATQANDNKQETGSNLMPKTTVLKEPISEFNTLK